MKNLLIILFLMILCCLLVFAGGKQEVKPAEKVTVTLWHGLTAADGEYMESLMQRYCTEKNPNIKLEASAIAWSDLYTKMKTAYISKTLPTMLIFHVHHVPIYQDNAIHPIDDLIGPLNLKEKLVPAFYDMTKWEGKTYYIPLSLVTHYQYFHKQDLIDLGYDTKNPPGTIEDLTDYCLKVQEDKDILGTQIGWSYGSMWNEMLHSAGGTLFDKTGTKAAFNSPAGSKALNVYLDWWYDKEITPREEVGSWDDQAKRFVNHGVSCWHTGSSAIGHIDSIGRENMAYQHSPGFKGKRAYTTAYFHGCALPRMGTEDESKAALEIVNWMLEPDINADFSAGSGQLPGAKAGYNTKIWKEIGWWFENGKTTKVTPVPYISHKKQEKIIETFNIWFNKVRDRKITPEEGLAGAEKDVNKILAE